MQLSRIRDHFICKSVHSVSMHEDYALMDSHTYAGNCMGNVESSGIDSSPLMWQSQIENEH